MRKGVSSPSAQAQSQIPSQNCCFPKTCPTGATMPQTRHVAGETANFLLKWTPTQLGENAINKPLHNTASKPALLQARGRTRSPPVPLPNSCFPGFFFTISWPLHSPQAHGLLRNCLGQTVPSHVHLNHFFWGLSQRVTGGKL